MCYESYAPFSVPLMRKNCVVGVRKANLEGLGDSARLRDIGEPDIATPRRSTSETPVLRDSGAAPPFVRLRYATA